ncbi:MAG: hypothetical protein A4E73_01685 [Syntrophaceae bacterium PtaU1.Bin231]|nr:MAG: hypothetical protein A4E73_01685 [Syntrophaceae bacterium PtaU1.Bin231]
MNKRAFLGVFLAAVFVVSLVGPLMAAERYSPNKNHTGNLGTSTRIWQYGYIDNLVGDGTNATLYGFKKSVKVMSATDSQLSVSDCGKVITNSNSAELLLPAPTVGCEFWFYTRVANLVVNPSTDAYYIRAHTNAAGDKLQNTTVGNALYLIATSTTEWMGFNYGTWSDVNH